VNSLLQEEMTAVCLRVRGIPEVQEKRGANHVASWSLSIKSKMAANISAT